MALADGLLTSGDIEQLLLVGPMLPATKRGFSFDENSLAISLAILTAVRFISLT